MKNKHIVLYVPGLGDHRLKMRQRFLNLWHYKNVTTEIITMQWSIPEAWGAKLDSLTSKINSYHDLGYTVSLIGESAGASAVLQALNTRTESLNAVILLCGKSQYPDRVAQRLYQKNPALKDAMVGSHSAVSFLTEAQRKKVLNLHPLFDPVVPVHETKILGTKDSTMPIVGHILGIGFGMTIWSFKIVRFMRKQARNKGNS